MKRTMLTLFLLGISSAAFSAEKHYQQAYAETVLEPIPADYHKLTSRLAKWNHDAEGELSKLEQSTHPRVTLWLKKIKAVDGVEGQKLLDQVNSITNQAVTYKEDYSHYGKDYWAPPYETLVEGGDCEDIALLKAVALHIHGWDVKQRGHVLIGMINFKGKSTPHAVLQIDRGDGKYYVMRSINNDVLSFDEMTKIMRPIYMISSKNLVVFNEEGQEFAYNLFADDANINTAAGENKTASPAADSE